MEDVTSCEKALLSWIDYGYYSISLSQFSLELMFEYYKTKTNTFFPKPPTPCQGASSITEMMDHHTDCNKERPNGVAGGLSLRKGAFVHENLSSARKKQSSSLNPFIEGFPIKQYPPHYIDKYARKIFPLLFGLFNIIYWSYYLPRR